MMALDRHRLKHLSEQGVVAAIRCSKLLDNVESLIGAILLGNNFANIVASSISTIIALRISGEEGIAVATGLLTLAVLIFAEITPKTLAANKAETIAFPASYVLQYITRALAPIVAFTNTVAAGFLWLLGQNREQQDIPIDADQLRTIVSHSTDKIPENHQKMLLRLLDLDEATVEHIMIPKNEIVGIDIQSSVEHILIVLTNVPYTRIPLYDENISNVKGIIHVRDALHLLDNNNFSIESLLNVASPPYNIPATNSLLIQVQKFRDKGERTGFIIDEYGTLKGMITLDDILEEIIGTYTSDLSDTTDEFLTISQNHWSINASVSLREINETCQLNLQSEEATTINGLVLEILGNMPRHPLCIALPDCHLYLEDFKDNIIRTVEIEKISEQKEPHAAH